MSTMQSRGAIVEREVPVEESHGCMRTAVVNWLTNFFGKAALTLAPSRGIIERRASPRTSLNSPLAVLSAGNQTYRGVCRDISASGLGAIVYGDLLVHQNVRLRFSLATGRGINVPAVVRYRYGSRYGFEFLELVDTSSEIREQD